MRATEPFILKAFHRLCHSINNSLNLPSRIAETSQSRGFMGRGWHELHEYTVKTTREAEEAVKHDLKDLDLPKISVPGCPS